MILNKVEELQAEQLLQFLPQVDPISPNIFPAPALKASGTLLRTPVRNSLRRMQL